MRADEVLEKNKDASQPEELRSAFESLQSVAHKIAEALLERESLDGGDIDAILGRCGNDPDGLGHAAAATG